MLSPSTAWKETVVRDNARIRMLAKIYNGTDTWSCVSGSMDSGSDLSGTDADLINVKPLGIDLDPLTREFKTSLIEVTVSDPWIRPFWVLNRLKGQRCNVSVGAAELDEADFEPYVTNAQIEEVIPNSGESTVTLRLLGQLAIINRFHVSTNYWLNKHPLECLYAGDGTGVLEIAGGHSFNANSFDPTQAEYDEIDHVIVSRAYTRISGGSNAGQRSDWSGFNHASKQTGGQLTQELVRLMNGQLIENGAGELEFKIFDSGASADDNWGKNDIIPGTLKQDIIDANAINQFVANFAQGWDSEDLTRTYIANDTASQLALKFPGESERIMSHEWDSPWTGTPMWLKADITDSATSLILFGISCYALSGNRSDMTVNAGHPVWLMLDSSYIHGTNNVEIIKATSLTQDTSSAGVVNVFAGGTTWVSAGPFVSKVTLSGVSRAQRGTTASAHFRGAESGSTWVYDITPIVLLCDNLLRRFSYGCPIIDIETPVSKYGLEIGDLVTLETQEYLSYDQDGLDGTELWEIVSKEADFFASPPRIKWKLASAEVSAPTFTGVGNTTIAGINQVANAIESNQAGQFFVADGFLTTQDSDEIDSQSDPGGGKTRCTSSSHGLQNGDTVVITETVNYNGTYTVSAVTTNTFDITIAFVVDEGAGVWTASYVATTGSGIIAAQAEMRPTLGNIRSTFAASKDTYLYATVAATSFGGIVRKAVANAAADPGTGEDEIYIGKVVTDANGITAITNPSDTDDINKEPFPGVKIVKESVGTYQTIAENIGRNHNFDSNVWSRGANFVADGWNVR